MNGLVFRRRNSVDASQQLLLTILILIWLFQVQAWWRGLMVRKGIGAFAEVLKMMKKVKKDKKEKKGKEKKDKGKGKDKVKGKDKKK